MAEMQEVFKVGAKNCLEPLTVGQCPFHYTGPNPARFWFFFISLLQMLFQSAASRKTKLEICPVWGLKEQDRNHKWDEAFEAPFLHTVCPLFSLWHVFHCDSDTNWPHCFHFSDIWIVFLKRNLRNC